VLEAIFVAGPAASGKTRLARSLSEKLRIPIVDLDDSTADLLATRTQITPAISINDFLCQHRAQRYGEMLARARQIIDSGKSVIVTAPFSDEIKDLARWREIANEFESHGASVRLVWISVDGETLARRLIARGEARDADKTANKESLRRHLEHTRQEPPVVPHLRVEAAWDLQEQINLTIR